MQNIMVLVSSETRKVFRIVFSVYKYIAFIGNPNSNKTCHDSRNVESGTLTKPLKSLKRFLTVSKFSRTVGKT